MKNSIIDNIKSLPPLSKTIMDINAVYANENASLKDMAQAIEGDPMIVANILKVANSPLYGFSKDIKSVSHAVSLFGMGMTRSIALGNSVRKLLNLDMQPYGITSEDFAHISSLQATLMMNWYKHIDKAKAEKLYLAAFLQETGKILIADDIIAEDETISFYSEVETTNDLAGVERSYVDVSSSEVTAEVFKHWGFDDEFVEIIKFADKPKEAPEEIQEYCMALNIVKTAIPVNKPLSETAVNFAIKKAEEAGCKSYLLKEEIEKLQSHLGKVETNG